MDDHGSTLAATLARITIDLGTGALVDHAKGAALAPARRLIETLLFPRWSGAFEAVELNLHAAVEALRAKDRGVLEALQRSFARGEADALVAHCLTAASQATTEPRMTMLAAAAAGVVFTPDLDSEMRSRVARAVTQLEPSDVQHLRALAEIERGRHLGDARRGRVLGPSRSALEAAGCIAMVTHAQALSRAFESTVRRPSTSLSDPKPKPKVTETGEAVLKALGEWTPGDDGPPRRR
jgi:hypothetical protein